MKLKGRKSKNIRDLRGMTPEQVAREALRRGEGQRDFDRDLDYTQDLRTGVPIYTEDRDSTREAIRKRFWRKS